MPSLAHTLGRRTAFGATLLAAGMVVAACGTAAYPGQPAGSTTQAQTTSSSSQSSSSSGAAGAGGYGSAATSAAAPGDASIRTGSSSLGTILTDAAGATLYLFEKDTGTTSTCDGACAAAWPPATVSGTAPAGAGASAKLVGTTTRTDGTRQLTYAGHPLYRFSGDGGPGSLKGQGLRAFGAGWYVVDPSGMKIDND